MVPAFTKRPLHLPPSWPVPLVPLFRPDSQSMLGAGLKAEVTELRLPPVPVPGPFCLRAHPGRRLGLRNQRLALGGGQWPTPVYNPQFDLVCGEELNREAVHTTFLAGLLIGSLTFGFISDK